MLKKITGLCLATAIAFTVPSAMAEESMKHHGDKDMAKHHAKEIKLAPELREVIIQEMRAIQKGMMDMVNAIVTGDWEKMASIGKRIEGKHIIKQKLSKEQMEQIHKTMPHSFHEIDYKFHSAAGRMAHAAEEHDGEVVRFYFAKLTDMCVQCHTKFARKRFPNLGLTHKPMH